MLISAFIYIFALIAVLSEKLLIFISVLSIAFIFFIIKRTFPLKYILVLTLLFYIGVINTSIRLKDIDELLNLTPINCEISGTIVSIPQGLAEGKPKFFFDVDKIKFGSVEKELKDEKVLVTLNSNDFNKDLKIYNSATLEGRLSSPFKAGNPSQFDYGNYLRNHNTYAVFYGKLSLFLILLCH